MSFLAQYDEPGHGMWIKKLCAHNMSQNGFTIGRKGSEKVVYLSPTTFEVTTCTYQEFRADGFVYVYTQLKDFRRMINDFISSTKYIEACKTADEVERNAQYCSEHPESWKTDGHEPFNESENAVFACYCTSNVKNEVNRGDIKLGDHIYIICKVEMCLTTKHGIVVQFRHNRELGVVFFSEERSTICTASIEEFADGRPIGRANYVYDKEDETKTKQVKKGCVAAKRGKEDCAAKPVTRVISLAMMFAQDPQKWIKEYHPNPSMRFAEFCKKKVTQPIPFSLDLLTLEQGDHIFAKDEDDFYRSHGIFLGQDDPRGQVALFSRTNSFTSLEQFFRQRTPYWCSNPLPIVLSSNISIMSKDDSNERVGYLFHFILKSNLKPGDHIYAYRKLGFYQHHGIYIGHTEKYGKHTVVHFTGTGGGLASKHTATIIESSLEDFLGWDLPHLVCYGASLKDMKSKISGTTQTLESLPSEVVVETAKYYAENPSAWDYYHLFNNNCEMFALYCKTGIKVTGSSQVHRFTNLVMQNTYCSRKCSCVHL